MGQLLATPGLFLTVVAILLSAVGRFGVLHYSVLQRCRDIGIRLARGYRTSNIVRLVCGEVFIMMVVAEVLLGILLGSIAVKPIDSLFYGVIAIEVNNPRDTDPDQSACTTLEAFPSLLRGVRIDP